MGRKKKETFWYSFDRILSYNKMLNFVIGNRGGGKTYASKEYCIRKFIKTGEKFIYMRRYSTELKKQQIEKFFDDVRPAFKNHDLKVVGNVGYCDNKEMVYFIPLSKAQRVKSTSYIECTTIIFDEFLIKTKGLGSLKYIDNEVEVFAEFLMTVNRLRGEEINGLKDNLKVLFVANNISSVNPYFEYFNIRPKQDAGIYTFPNNKQIAVEYFYSEEYIAQVMKTRVAELFANTHYLEYAINNKTLDDQTTFVEKRPRDAKFDRAVRFDGKVYGFWWGKDGTIYMDNKYDKSSVIYSLSLEDHEKGSMFYKALKRAGTFRHIIMAYDMGDIRFHDEFVADAFLRMYSILA